MKNKIILFFAVSWALFFSLPASAQGDKRLPAAPKENRVSLDIKGMDIVDVLKMIAARAGLNIVVGKNVAGRVTLFLKDVNTWDAFELILLANDLAYEEKDGILNVMTQRDYELIYGERYKDKKEAQIIQLKYAKAQDLSAALNQMKTGAGKIVIDAGSNTLALIDLPYKIKEMKTFIESVDMPLETKVFSLDYAQVEKLGDKIKELSSKNVGSVRIDERTNRIVVTDYPEKIKDIEKIISAFDEKTPQVLIDAQIIEISPDKDEFSMGVDWDYWLKNNVRLIGNLAAPALSSAAVIPTKISLGVAAAGESVASPGQYKSIVDALRVIGQTKILSSPRLMVLNNQEARILVGTKDAYITSTLSQGSSGQIVTAQSVNFVDTGIKLFVTPTVNRDGFVTMKIRPEISSATYRDIKSDDKETAIPIVTTSETETTIMIKDSTTIIIAGLKKDRTLEEIKKIPILGDIPFLKYIFRNTKKEINKTELVIFITPHIVSGEEPLEYVSSNQDKDVAYLQALAKTQYKESLSNEADNARYYQESVFNRIKNISKAMGRGGEYAEGEVELIFKLDASGYLEEEPVVVYSTNEKLNELAVESVKESAPFPPFPGSLKKKNQVFKIGLAYK